MAYLNPDSILNEEYTPEEFLENTARRKEYLIFTPSKVKSVPHSKIYNVSEDLIFGNYLRLHGYQKFIVNYFSPHTNNYRGLIKWQTGAGKSVPMLKLGIERLNYQKEHQPNEVGYVIILGFSHSAFKKELLQYPELGFLSREEKEMYKKIQSEASRGSKVAQEAFQEFAMMIKRRLTQKSRFIFMGYKQFTNVLFQIKHRSVPVGEEETEDEESVEQQDVMNISDMKGEQIKKMLEEGKISLNKELIDMFRNSLVICDEIHEVYNSKEKNNWGLALSTILGITGLNLTTLFLSATPINNSPTEIVDLLNLLLPPEHAITKEDLFLSPGYSELRPGALELIGKCTAGRVSFLQDRDPSYYPKRILHGTPIKGVPMLKFVRCPMSQYHYNTYKQFSDSIPQDSHNIIDILLPDPLATDANSGLFQSQQIHSRYTNASAEWKQKHGVTYIDGIIGGSFLHKDTIGKYSRKFEHLIDLLHSILKVPESGKIFIYHDAVHTVGVILIGELLKANGFIPENAEPTEDTLCSICGKPRRVHKIKKASTTSATSTLSSSATEQDVKMMPDLVELIQGGSDMISPDLLDLPVAGSNSTHTTTAGSNSTHTTTAGSNSTHTTAGPNSTHTTAGKSKSKKGGKADHEFAAARFILGHSEIEKQQFVRSLERFNVADNLYGHQIRIVVGSQLMQASHDLKACRKCIVARRPENISSLIQIMGRAYRNGSHKMLPPEQQTIDYYLFTSCCPDGKQGYEEMMYARKISQYQQIQKIESAMHRYAVDALINYERIKNSFESDDRLSIDSLHYEPILRTRQQSEMTTDTYRILYSTWEVDIITCAIKRIFIEYSPVWTYEDLWRFMTSPTSPIALDIGINQTLLEEHYFIAALSRLVTEPTGAITKITLDEKEDYIDKLNNPHDKVILLPTALGGAACRIYAVEQYYILMPIDRVEPDMQYRFSKRSNDRMIISLDQYASVLDETSDVFMHTEWEMLKNINMGKQLEELEPLLCSYSSVFHEYVLRIIIPELSRALIKKNDDYWTIAFYARLLIMYDIMGVIVWASDLTGKYNEWTKPKCGYSDSKLKIKGECDKTIKPMQKCTWCSPKIIGMYYNKLNILLQLIANPGNIFEDMYPTGYSIGKSHLYNPSENVWIPYAPQPVKPKENDIIIGYDEHIENELIVRFKLRNPLHKMVVHEDIRKLEKGTACSSKSKEQLISLAEQLKIPVEETNVANLCTNIRYKLISNELDQRQHSKEKRIKWFYFVHEYNPMR